MNVKKFAKYAAVVIVTLIIGSCVFGGDSSTASSTPVASSTPSSTASSTPVASSKTPGAYEPSFIMQAAWDNITPQQRQDIRTGWELAKMVGTETEFITMMRDNVPQIESDREARQFLDWTLDN